MDYKTIILIVSGIVSLIFATVAIAQTVGVPWVHSEKYRIKIVKTRKETTYYPQYRNHGWCNFKTMEPDQCMIFNVSFSSLEDAEDYITKHKQREEDQKETITYKYL